MADKSFAIYMQHRPRRIAFLVDLGHEAVDKVLDSILQFNLNSWGGRHNPIVPLTDKRIPEALHPLLNVADPDIFYVYGELEQTELEHIHSLYSPTLVASHTVRGPVDDHSYHVSLREQASVAKYLTNLRSKMPPHLRRHDISLLHLEFAEERSLSRFFLWNFGYTSSIYFAIQNHGIPASRPKSTMDSDLLELLASSMFLAWPIFVCADAPLARTAADPWLRDFTVFYGDSPWNLVAYWNDGLKTGPTNQMQSGLGQLWLTKTQLEHEPTYKHLIRLLQRRVYSDGHHQKGVKLISCDTSEEELEQLAKKIVHDVRGTLHYGGVEKFDPPYAPPLKPQRVRSFLPTPTDIEYATGNEVHLSLKHPPDMEENSDQCWMVDVYIHNPGQELWYANAQPWWRLPRKPSIAGLFQRGRPQRILFDNRISFEVDARETTLDFEIPSNDRLFRHLLSPDVHYHLAADLRSRLNRSPIYDIRLSDKGRYLSGILHLSNSLKEILYLFEHPFFRSLVERLSRREPSEQQKAKLASDIHDLWKDHWSIDEARAKSFLVESATGLAKQLPRAPEWLTFGSIQQLHKQHLESLQPEERQRSETDLKADLSGLTMAGAILQGAALRCPNCKSQLWYAIEDLHKLVQCRGCQTQFPLPAETTWSYRLNELIRAGVGDHGLLPVLRTLARLFDGAHDCFFFTPSVEFLDYPNQGDPVIQQELDLAWVRDGMFGIAEVKTNSQSFEHEDYEDLATLAQRLGPDVVLIAAHEGEDGDLAKAKRLIEEKLGPKFVVEAWGPARFEKSPHWVM